MSIISKIGELAKVAGKWAIKNPDTVKFVADTATEMRENAKARKQAEKDASIAAEEATAIEAIVERLEVIEQNESNIVTGLTNAQAAVDVLNEELTKAKESIDMLGMALEETQTKLDLLETKHRKEMLIYGVCSGIAFVLAVILAIFL